MNRKKFFSIVMVLMLALLCAAGFAEEAAVVEPAVEAAAEAVAEVAAEPTFVDKVSEINGAINSFAWGPIMQSC